MRVSAVTVSLFEVVFALALVGVVDGLVQIADGGEVIDGGEDVAGVAGDGVETSVH